MKRCAQCHGKLGLGVRSRNLWNGRWWVHVRFCSVHCEDLYKPAAANGTNSSQCVVMGIGSTAFPKLLGQQSVNAKIYTALGKLPWGFANNSGGSKALDAWEDALEAVNDGG